MTAADHAAPPPVPTVTVSGRFVQIHADALAGMIELDAGPTVPAHVAACLRGALADAYRAGLADGRRRAELDAQAEGPPL